MLHWFPKHDDPDDDDGDDDQDDDYGAVVVLLRFCRPSVSHRTDVGVHCSGLTDCAIEHPLELQLLHRIPGNQLRRDALDRSNRATSRRRHSLSNVISNGPDNHTTIYSCYTIL